MNRSELIKKLSDTAEIPIDISTQVVSVFVDSLKQALLQGNRIELRGFGSFKVKEYRGYTGRNPKTGEQVEVKPKKMPFFRAGKELKQSVNNIQQDER